MVQTAVTQSPARAYPGMPADSAFKDDVAGILQTVAGATPGILVVRNGTEGDCVVPSSSADITSQKVLGFVLRDIAREPAAFARYDSLSLRRKGRLFVPCEDAFTVGDAIHVRHTTTTTETVGGIRASAVSNKTVLIPGVILNSGDGAAGDLALIEINFPFAADDSTAADPVLGAPYTPTITAGTNTATPTAVVGWYLRIANTVFVGGRCSISHTAGAPTASDFDVSLPVASALAAAGDLAGVASGPQVSLADVVANTTNDRAKVEYSIAATGAQTVSWQFSYTVI